MKKKEKQIILGIVVLIAIIVVILIVRNSGEKKEENVAKDPSLEFVEVKEDGTKVNVSNKLKETKKLGSLEISNIRLVEKNNVSYIEANVKNTGSSKDGDCFITLKILDKNGQELAKVDGYLDTMEAGKESVLSSRTSADFANAYDFTVSK